MSVLLPVIAALLVAGAAFLVQRARERKHRTIRAEAAATRARLQASLSNVGVAVLAVSRDGHVTWGEGGLGVLNFGRAALIGRSAWDAFHDVPELTAALRAGLRGSRGVERVRVGGASLDVSYTPRFDEAGKITEVVSVIRDVSHEQVEADRAERLADVRSQILGVMGYRLRGQLASVIGAAELAQQDDSPAAWLGEVGSAGTRLLTYVEHLVDFLEIDAGRMRSHAAPFSLRAVLDRLEDRYRPRARADGTVFVVRAPRAPLDFEGDGGRLEQALDLLLSVAIGTNPGGQVVLNVDLQPKEAGVAGLLISIEDSGRGLSSGARARVFDGFDSPSAFWATRSGKSGLELPLAKRLAELLGGTLEVESELGRGTSLRLRLELPRTWLAGQVPAEERPTLSSGRLLLVDDDGQQRRVHRALAESCGWTVIEARHGSEALESLERGLLVDAVLTELHMPVLDGTGLLDRVHERWPELSCGVLTADARPDSRSRAQGWAVAAWAVKPIGVEAMAALLTDLGRQGADEVVASSASSPVDELALRRLTSLDPVEGPGLARQLIDAFVAAAPLQLLGLASAPSLEGDHDAAEEIIASLTVSARLLGLSGLTQALSEVEAEWAEGRAGQDSLQAVATEVRRACAALARVTTAVLPSVEVAA